MSGTALEFRDQAFMFWAGRTQSCIRMMDNFHFFLFSFSHATELVWSCQATVAQNKIQQFLANCSASVKIYYDPAIKWLCDSSITSKQTEKKSLHQSCELHLCFLRPSLTQPPDCLHPLFFLTRLMLPPTRCCSSPVCACALRERARGSWSGLHASERCLGLILGYSWTESRREREGGQGHYIMLTLFSRCLNIMKADHKIRCGNKSAT